MSHGYTGWGLIYSRIKMTELPQWRSSLSTLLVFRQKAKVILFQWAFEVSSHALVGWHLWARCCMSPNNSCRSITPGKGCSYMALTCCPHTLHLAEITASIYSLDVGLCFDTVFGSSFHGLQMYSGIAAVAHHFIVLLI